jgi:VCBS repeat-containing protein
MRVCLRAVVILSFVILSACQAVPGRHLITSQCEGGKVLSGDACKSLCMTSNDCDIGFVCVINGGQGLCEVQDQIANAGLSFTGDYQLTVQEGDNSVAQYTVVMSRRPLSDVIVTLITDASRLRAVNHADGKPVVRFTSRTWNVPARIDVSAVDNVNQDLFMTSWVKYAITTEDPDYKKVPIPDLQVTIRDDDVASLTLKALSAPILSNPLGVIEGGALTQLLAISLTTQPFDSVDLIITPSVDVDIGNGNGKSYVLAFASTDWNVLQALSVRVSEDGVENIDRTATLNFGLSTSDPFYTQIEMSPITFNVIDSGFRGAAPLAVDDVLVVDEDTVSATIDVLRNDADDGYPELPGKISVVSITQPINGNATVIDGKVSYRPKAQFYGPDPFTYTVTDGANPRMATVYVTVKSVNDALPIPSLLAFSTEEDTPYTLTLSGSDADNATSSLLFSFTDPVIENTSTSCGTLSLATTSGALGPLGGSYIPEHDFNGRCFFTYSIEDLDGDITTQVVQIDVIPKNDPPVAIPQGFSVDEDTVYNSRLAGIDIDVGTTIKYSLDDSNTHGKVTLDVDSGSFSYKPDQDFNGTASFTFKAFDGLLYSNEATVTINVVAVNDKPTVIAQTLNIKEDAVASITLTGIDTVERSALTTFTVSPMAGQGTLSCTDASCSYTPPAEVSGDSIATFTFTVTDTGVPAATSDPATVTINIAPVNDKPTALPQTLNIEEDTKTPITLAGTDMIEGNALDQFTVSALAGLGTLSCTGSSCDYTPPADYYGESIATFTFTVTDNGTPSPATSDPATVTINIRPVNDKPTAIPQTFNIQEDAETHIILTGTDTIEGNALTDFTVSALVGLGTLSCAGSGCTYRPAPNASGIASFTFTATDNGEPPATSDPATVTINIAPVNDKPTAIPQTLTIQEDMATSITLTGTDTIEGDALSKFTASALVGTGTLSCDGSLCTYKPIPNASGIATFTFTVTDNGTPLLATSEPATVTINIQPVNDEPVANLPAAITLAPVTSGAEESTITFTLNGSDPVERSAIAQFSVTSKPCTWPDGHVATCGTVTCTAFGNCNYTPPLNFNGTANFSYTVTDTGTPPAISKAVDFSIRVTESNDAPVAIPQTITVNEDLMPSYRGTLTGSDVDFGQTKKFIILNTDNAHGNLILENESTGTFTYQPANNFSGTASFTFAVKDNGTTSGDSDIKISAPATITINVRRVNDRPTISAPPLVTVAQHATSSAIELTSTDMDAGATAIYYITTAPSKGTLSWSGSPPVSIAANQAIASGIPLNGPGTLTYVSHYEAGRINVTDSFAYRAHDGSAAYTTADASLTSPTSAAATVNINITFTNDLPTGTAVGNVYFRSSANYTSVITITGSDPEGDAIKVYPSTASGLGPVMASWTSSGLNLPATIYVTPQSATASLTFKICDASGQTNCGPNTAAFTTVGRCGNGIVEGPDFVAGDPTRDIKEMPEACEGTITRGLGTTLATCNTVNCQLGCNVVGQADCNNKGSDGCEATLATDVNNCGGCGNICFGSCSAGVCSGPSKFMSSGKDGVFYPSANVVLASGIYNYTSVIIPTGITVTTTGTGILDIRATQDIFVSSGALLSVQPPMTTGIALSSGVDYTGVASGFAGFCPSGGNCAAGSRGVNSGRTTCSDGTSNAISGGLGGNLGGGLPGECASGGGGGGGFAGGGGGAAQGQAGTFTAGVAGGHGGGLGGGAGGAATPGLANPNGNYMNSGVGGSSGNPSYNGKPGASNILLRQTYSQCAGNGGGGSIGSAAGTDLAVRATFYPGSGGGGAGEGGEMIGGYLAAPGGGGGGALRLAANGGGLADAVNPAITTAKTITIAGTLSADGAAGTPGSNPTSSFTYRGAGGGGGSGGVIFLQAPAIISTGTVTATGGTALGCGDKNVTHWADSGGLGRIRISLPTSNPVCSLSGKFDPPLNNACAKTGIFPAGIAEKTYISFGITDF